MVAFGGVNFWGWRNLKERLISFLSQKFRTQQILCEFDVYRSILLRISSVCSDSGQEVKNFHPNVQ
jgi:hypothetical protein